MAANIPESWYEVRTIGDNVNLVTETWIADWLRCNIWHVRGKTHDLVIDTGMGVRPLKSEIARLSDNPIICISTHCHFDHIGGAHEFDCRLAHRSEENIHSNPTAESTGTAGFVRAETFLALPFEGYTWTDYTVTPAPLTGYIDEGDVIDLGNRHFQVLHLPGHSPGSIALWEEKTGILFSGDTVYDGDLYDTVYHSNRSDYRESLMRLREWPVNVIHGGHGESFGRSRMREIADNYLEGRGVMENVHQWIENEIARGASREQ